MVVVGSCSTIGFGHQRRAVDAGVVVVFKVSRPALTVWKLEGQDLVRQITLGAENLGMGPAWGSQLLWQGNCMGGL